MCVIIRYYADECETKVIKHYFNFWFIFIVAPVGLLDFLIFFLTCIFFFMNAHFVLLN